LAQVPVSFPVVRTYLVAPVARADVAKMSSPATTRPVHAVLPTAVPVCDEAVAVIAVVCERERESIIFSIVTFTRLKTSVVAQAL
jgi:hypothetical protein